MCLKQVDENVEGFDVVRVALSEARDESLDNGVEQRTIRVNQRCYLSYRNRPFLLTGVQHRSLLFPALQALRIDSRHWTPAQHSPG